MVVSTRISVKTSDFITVSSSRDIIEFLKYAIQLGVPERVRAEASGEGAQPFDAFDDFGLTVRSLQNFSDGFDPTVLDERLLPSLLRAVYQLK
jgi:hypothetical protein